jgi:hypothetical protein
MFEKEIIESTNSCNNLLTNNSNIISLRSCDVKICDNNVSYHVRQTLVDLLKRTHSNVSKNIYSIKVSDYSSDQFQIEFK